MLTLNDVACRRDGKLLFDRASLVVHAGQKVGLTGANGTGKSSLFAMMRGVLEPDDGEILLPRGVGITHVAQETPGTERSALDHVVDGDERVRALEAEMATLGDDDGVRHAALLAEFDEAGGWSVAARAGALLNGLGFAEAVHADPVSSFSGGWRMRLNLAQALLSPNELLLLDEPTNHLDLDAVLWLEEWLRKRDGTLVLISHDREFLDAITTHTLHIERGTVTLATGNYTAFERQRAAKLANQQATHEKAEARRKELQSFVDRFRAKATKARQAQSRLKMLERMGTTEAVRPDSSFSFSFREPAAMPSPLVTLERADIGYGDGDPVLENVRFGIQSGDRIGLLGANGAGKSTLVKALVGELVPESGARTPARKLVVGYFAQHQVDRLRSDRTPLEALIAEDPSLSESAARGFLGGFGFEGERALQRAETLSGGERARLALALIVHARPNLLLLDEPTNHLDIDMRQALADALQLFEGALLVISHDRVMLRSVVDGLWLVSDHGVRPFDDDLDGYARWLAKRRADTADNAGVVDVAPDDAGNTRAGSGGVGKGRAGKGRAGKRRAGREGGTNVSGRSDDEKASPVRGRDVARSGRDLDEGAGTGTGAGARESGGVTNGSVGTSANGTSMHAGTNGRAGEGTSGPVNAGGHGDGRANGTRGKGAASPDASGTNAEERKRQRREQAERRGRLAPLRREIERDERKLAAASERLGNLRTRLAAPGLYDDEAKATLAGLLEDEGDARRVVESLEESLLLAMERLERAETDAGDPRS